MRGRKPLPDNVRQLRGNPGKRKRASGSIEAPAGVPDKPPTIRRSKLASAKWDELVPILETMGVLTLAERSLLELACSLYAKYCRKGTAALAARYQSCLAELGLTPTARARLSRPQGAKSRYESFRKPGKR